MWLLSPEQATRLGALARQRDLERIGDALAAAFPDAPERLGARWAEFLDHGARRAAACGLEHVLCVARYLAACIVCGADFETRLPWAAGLLGDARRPQGAKAFQLGVRMLEESGPPRPGASDPSEALRLLDDRLAAAGTLGSLLPRERIRLGAACDLDVVDLRLVDTQWRQHYTVRNGVWQREGCAPRSAELTLVHDPLAEQAPSWPAQVTLLARSSAGEAGARLRVRMRAEHRCDPLVHPLLHEIEPAGARLLRGDVATDVSWAVLARPREAAPHVGEEDSPQMSTLSVAACGLRPRGVPVGRLSTLLAAYDSTQHLIGWRREPTPDWRLPEEAPPPVLATRCRREADGRGVDSAEWVSGFQALDEQLRQGMARLLTAWERESGVTEGRLEIQAGLLEGHAGITWGWAERPAGIVEPPYMRLEALFDLVACRLALRFAGSFALAGSRSRLELSTTGRAVLAGPWQRGPEDDELFAAAARLQVAVRQGFELRVRPVADAGLALLSPDGPVEGAIAGSIGLEQRPDGPGLRWFVRLALEPVVAPLRVHDPLLGLQFVRQPLLPKQTLLDWNLA